MLLYQLAIQNVITDYDACIEHGQNTSEAFIEHGQNTSDFQLPIVPKEVKPLICLLVHLKGFVTLSHFRLISMTFPKSKLRAHTLGWGPHVFTTITLESLPIKSNLS